MRLTTVTARSFGRAHYELINSILAWGVEIPTDYDKPDEPPSLDLTVAIEITHPWNPPIFSKCVYDSAEGLMDYKDEIVEGTHDHLVEQMGYTYHDRFADQLEGVEEEIMRNPHTRRAQFITWQPEIDLGDEYPPCLQRGWFRVVNGRLNFHSVWRSRDSFKAWGSNIFGLAHLHKKLAEKWGYPVGEYIEFIDSCHIYGRDREMAFNLSERPIEDWLWTLEEILSHSTT